jgi:hypothetical protein
MHGLEVRHTVMLLTLFGYCLTEHVNSCTHGFLGEGSVLGQIVLSGVRRRVAKYRRNFFGFAQGGTLSGNEDGDAYERASRGLRRLPLTNVPSVWNTGFD